MFRGECGLARCYLVNILNIDSTHPGPIYPVALPWKQVRFVPDSIDGPRFDPGADGQSVKLQYISTRINVHFSIQALSSCQTSNSPVKTFILVWPCQLFDIAMFDIAMFVIRCELIN